MICELDRQLQKANHRDGTFEGLPFSYASKDRRQIPSRIELSVIHPYSLFISHPLHAFRELLYCMLSNSSVLSSCAEEEFACHPSNPDDGHLRARTQLCTQCPLLLGLAARQLL